MNKYQKGFAPIIIALIVLVLAGAGGTGYYLISKQVKLSNNQNLQNNNIDISDWKIYTNSDADFEIKYPSSWESPFGNWGPGFTAGTSIDNNNLCVIDAMGWSGSNDAEIADLIGKGYVKTSIKIDGIDGIRLTRNPAEAGLTEAVYFEANGKSFRIGRNRGTNDKIEQDCIKNFNQIINSFRFINEQANIDKTADWLTYTNKEYKFEFKYPKDWIVDDRYAVNIISPEWQKTIEEGKNSEYSKYYQNDTCAYCFNISINSKIISQTLEEYILENQGGFSGTPQKIKFAGENAYEVVEVGALTINGIIVKKDNYLFNIVSVPGNKTETTTKIEKQILSTFKFLK
jgi:hypothetical protein